MPFTTKPSISSCDTINFTFCIFSFSRSLRRHFSTSPTVNLSTRRSYQRRFQSTKDIFCHQLSLTVIGVLSLDMLQVDWFYWSRVNNLRSRLGMLWKQTKIYGSTSFLRRVSNECLVIQSLLSPQHYQGANFFMSRSHCFAISCWPEKQATHLISSGKFLFLLSLKHVINWSSHQSLINLIDVSGNVCRHARHLHRFRSNKMWKTWETELRRKRPLKNSLLNDRSLCSTTAGNWWSCNGTAARLLPSISRECSEHIFNLPNLSWDNNIIIHQLEAAPALLPRE